MCERVHPDLVVLDLMLPGLDGLEVCRRIQHDRPVPVLMLTARDSETDMVVGLTVGADDYLRSRSAPRGSSPAAPPLRRARAGASGRQGRRSCTSPGPSSTSPPAVRQGNDTVHLTRPSSTCWRTRLHRRVPRQLLLQVGCRRLRRGPSTARSAGVASWVPTDPHRPRWAARRRRRRHRRRASPGIDREPRRPLDTIRPEDQARRRHLLPYQ
jgi:hypothetical protein